MRGTGACALLTAALMLIVAPSAPAQQAPIGSTKAPGPRSPSWRLVLAHALDVSLSWTDRATDEQGFFVSRRDAEGIWRPITRIATRDAAGTGASYTFIDSDTSLSGQCYMVAAYNAEGSAPTYEWCTVRPDPVAFPYIVPSDMQQWQGLSELNDGTGDLTNTHRSHLTYGDEEYGINLRWSDEPGLWKVEAPKSGGSHIMYGEAVALRAWGGGWLKHGVRTYGVDLVWSDTPVYEWYVVGLHQPGGTLNPTGEPFAIWNGDTRDYLVESGQTWGVDLQWFRKIEIGVW